MNQSIRHQIFTVLAFVLALTTTSPPASLAQTAFGLSAIPPRLEIEVQPGQVVTKEIKVRNESKIDKYINTSVRDFIVTDTLGTPIQLEDVDQSDNRWAASSWIQVSPTNLKLRPGETQNLMLTVITPDDATPGGHYAMVIHAPNNETVLNESGALVQANVGTLVYLNVPGAIKQNAKIKSFSAPSFSEYGPINFNTTITNLSDIHISPASSIQVTNLLGIKTASIYLQPGNIFPYTSRNFTAALNRKWLLGRYKAQLNSAYGTNGNLLTSTIFFWVIPWKLILVGLTVILIILALFLINRPGSKTNLKPGKTLPNNNLAQLKKKLKTTA